MPKERPILISGAMVRAILDGRKTQTRRVMKHQPGLIPEGYSPRVYWPARDHHMALMHMDRASAQWECPGEYDGANVLGSACGFAFPYGQPGDRLWVRETWALPAALDPGPTVYRADYPACVPAGFENVPPIEAITWKPSIHMPRAMSRITLEIADVRIERLNDCSEADAAAEGLYHDDSIPFNGPWFIGPEEAQGYGCPTIAYRDLWERINGAGSWDANPWVWVIEFKRVTA